MSLRRKKTEPAPEQGAQVIDLPILPTEAALGRLTTSDGAYAVVTLSTVLTSGTFLLDRGQAVKLAAEMMKLAEKLPNEKKKLELPPNAGAGLVIP